VNPLKKPLRRARGEEGASLMIALAFLALLGTFTAAILTVTYTSFKTTEVVRAQSSELYGADGGTDLGIQLLRTNSSYCPNAAAGSQSLPTQTINGKSVTITCQALSGSTGSGATSWPTTWPLIITGYNGLASNTTFSTSGSTGNTQTITFSGGPVFDAGGMTFAAGSDKVVFSNDVYEYDPYCTTAKGAATPGKPTVSGTWFCKSTGTYAVPDPVPTLIVPTATAHAPVTVGSCTIYFPGKYTSANEPAFSGSGHYYFASGVYYFEDVQSMNMNGDIFGGQPGPTDTQKFTAVNPCATDATANAQVPGSATGYGVEFVLGGNSYIDPTTNASSKIELFARQPAVPANEGTAGISFYAPRVSGTNYIANTRVDAITLGGNPNQLIFHGLVYVPNSDLKIWSTANAGAGGAPMFMGGLVTGALQVAMNGSSVSSTFATLPASTPASARSVLITTTATGTGDAPTTETAVVTIGTSSTTPPTITSWRKN